MSNIKNAFISHNHEDMTGCDALKNLLQNAGMNIVAESGFDITHLGNSKTQIDQCDVLVLYMTGNVWQSDLVKREFEYAEQIGIRVIVVSPHNGSNVQPPSYAGQSADAIVGWANNDIIDAINGNNVSKQANGAPFKKRKIKYHDC